MLKIRHETRSDGGVIEAVTLASFTDVPYTDNAESFMFRALRAFGALSVSLVVEEDDHVIGHLSVSPVTISDASSEWYGLGPISVAPQYQGKGVGTQLMEQALSELRVLGAAGCGSWRTGVLFSLWICSGAVVGIGGCTLWVLPSHFFQWSTAGRQCLVS